MPEGVAQEGMLKLQFDCYIKRWEDMQISGGGILKSLQWKLTTSKMEWNYLQAYLTLLCQPQANQRNNNRPNHANSKQVDTGKHIQQVH